MTQQKQRSPISLLKQQFNWQSYKLENIIGGKSADGVSLLELFLKDYMALFKVRTVNPQCNSCLRTYLNDYKLKLQEMANDCNYRLLKKYNGLPLEITGKNSSISVTNANITDEYAKILLKRYKDPAKIFDKYPLQKDCVDVCEKEELLKTTDEVKEIKVKKTRTKRKK